MRLMFPKGKTFPFLSRYVGVSLPDITQSMRFVPFLQPALPALLDDPSYPYSELYLRGSPLLLRKLYESDRAIPYFHFIIWYFTWG